MLCLESTWVDMVKAMVGNEMVETTKGMGKVQTWRCGESIW